MTEFATERHILEYAKITHGRFYLSVDFWLVKPVNVRKRELPVKTGNMRIYNHKHNLAENYEY